MLSHNLQFVVLSLLSLGGKFILYKRFFIKLKSLICLLECRTEKYILTDISTLFGLGGEMKKWDYSKNCYQNPTKKSSVESSFPKHLTRKKKILQIFIFRGFYAWFWFPDLKTTSFRSAIAPITSNTSSAWTTFLM